MRRAVFVGLEELDPSRRHPPHHSTAGGDRCTDDGKGTCTACGVALVLCPSCDGRGYHRFGCEAVD